mgnify:CR=1 FL=1
MNAPILQRHLQTDESVEHLAPTELVGLKEHADDQTESHDLEQVVDMLLGANGLEIKDRQYHLRRYRSCFVGSELIALLIEKLAISSESALALAKQLELAGHIRHVVGSHPFKDEYLFYRLNRVLTAPPEKDRLDRQQLAEIVQAMRAPEGMNFGVRYRWFVRYPCCFTGHEAVDWIGAYCEVSRERAEAIGKSLLRGNFIRHLFDEHDFSDAPLLFRFV